MHVTRGRYRLSRNHTRRAWPLRSRFEFFTVAPLCLAISRNAPSGRNAPSYFQTADKQTTPRGRRVTIFARCDPETSRQAPLLEPREFDRGEGERKKEYKRESAMTETSRRVHRWI